LSELDRLTQALGNLSQEELGRLSNEVSSAGRIWTPNIGPQTDAYFNAADELFYGGQAGGGKTDLICGLALTAHQQSLILRRFASDAMGVAERTMDILGSRDGFNGQSLKLRLSQTQAVDYGGCKDEADKERYKGRPHDLIGFDEICDFLESQYVFIIAWNRSVNPDQRCRIVGAGNPPTRAEGLWVIRRWAAWLNPNHPKYPYPDGHLLWYTSDDNGMEIEVDGPGPHMIKGEPVIARSRTFIRARLEDNPDLAETNYDAVLANLPPELRAAYREGRFDLGLKDKTFQVIPTAWVREAMDRWTPEPPYGIPMCAMGVDVAQGGEDETIISKRHDLWFDKLEAYPGSQTPDGPAIAGLVMSKRRHHCEIILDMGGGYGGSAYDHLRSNGVECYAYKGASKARGKTADGQLKFKNRRSEAHWRLREALDPGQFGGSRVALPRDEQLLADLTAPTYEVTPSGIQITPKKELVKMMGRSPDRGDAVVMCNYKGKTAVTNLEEWRSDQQLGIVGRVNQGNMKVNFGKHHSKPTRRRH